MSENSLMLEPKNFVTNSKTEVLKNFFERIHAISKADPGKITVVTIEELDFFKKDSSEVFYTLLSEIDNLPANALIIATTSNLDKIDQSIRRGGRIDMDIRLDTPSAHERYLILKEHLSHQPNNIADDKL